VQHSTYIPNFDLTPLKLKILVEFLIGSLTEKIKNFAAPEYNVVVIFRESKIPRPSILYMRALERTISLIVFINP